MKKNLIFAGAGHAHIYSLSNLHEFVWAGASVTVVNRSRYHYYSGMGPGLLSGYYTLDETRFDIKKIVESHGCRFIEAEVKQIFPDEKRIFLSDNTALSYDLISFNTGSEVLSLHIDGEMDNLFPVKPLENISLIRDRILASKKIDIAVIGGGAAGVEIAANLSELASGNSVDADISIISREHLLPGYSESFYLTALKYLKRRDVNIYEYRDVERIDSDNIYFRSGEKIGHDIVINASGIKPSSLFAASGMRTGADGGLPVDRYLHSADYPGIFAGGDCIAFEPVPLHKVGVYAVREGMILYRNLLAYIKSEKLQEFKPQKNYLAILNMAYRRGVMLWKGSVFSGVIPFYLKYYLDSSFMKKYRKRGA
jgi:NADH dehydrogenase FAD-containing subunit